jgi:hypothetical protein
MPAEHLEAGRPTPNPIAGYEDWPTAVRSAEPYVGADSAGTALGRLLGLRRLRGRPTVLDDGSRRLDGVLIRRLRWSVGYGPETTAWLLRPAGVRRSLPGVLGMHCHGGVRSVGAEQLVDLGADSAARAVWLRDRYYSGRAPANELPRQGYAVLVHDTFSWEVQHRKDVVAPPPSKLCWQLRRPVGAIHLEAVAEDGADELGRYGVEHRIADRVQVRLGGSRRVVVQDRTLRSGRRALDVLPGQPRVGEQHDARARPCLDH